MKVALLCVVVMGCLLADSTGQGSTFEFKCGVEEHQEEVIARMDAEDVKLDELQVQHHELQGKLDEVQAQNDDLRVKMDTMEEKMDDLKLLLEKVVTNTAPQWITIQRRGQFGKAANFFAKSMDDYKTGFGNTTGDFWLGLDELARLTKDGKWEMQVDLVDYADKTYSGVYHKFRVGAGPRYELEVGQYDSSKSTMGDDVFSYHNKMAFSTKDVDQDIHSGDCSNTHGGHGGWWYQECHHININGENTGNDKKDYTGMTVHTGGGWYVMIKETEMKMVKIM
eukprot:GFUD01132542.1.p1 GENE.GFUD01132542.1~~GFUD01132542.1.p1  ORF type:complete len:281 (+),score=100.20 GFUD01132542.1:140-982(+)